MTGTYRQWFVDRVIPRGEIDDYLDDDGTNWARFDAELGYVLSSSIQTDGVDGCCSVIHVDPGGNREMINYARRPCRINTYGDSFTQSSQVSNGETWQEVLAAHLGEPIRNFGVGGYGVYQAYLRLRREEERVPAENIIFYIWGDDHQRSLMPCRVLFTRAWLEKYAGRRRFHGNPWAHLEVDLDAGEVVETANSHPDPESLYELCDPDRLYERFSDNIVYQLAAMGDGVRDVDQARIRRLAEWAEYDLDSALAQGRRRACGELFRQVAHRGTMYVLDQLMNYAKARGKKVLVILGYPSGPIVGAVKGEPRQDAAVVEALQSKGIRFIDMRARHVEDAKQYNLCAEDYASRYYIGHYSPLGNFFFAFSIKDDVVDWLNPKPPTYRHRGPAIGFEGYIPG